MSIFLNAIWEQTGESHWDFFCNGYSLSSLFDSPIEMSGACSSSFFLSEVARLLNDPSPRSFAGRLAFKSLTRCFRTARSSLMEEAPRGSSAATAGFSSSSGGGEVRSFPLSPSSVLKIQKGDITVWSVDGQTDAIVSSKKSNPRLLFISTFAVIMGSMPFYV